MNIKYNSKEEEDYFSSLNDSNFLSFNTFNIDENIITIRSKETIKTKINQINNLLLLSTTNFLFNFLYNYNLELFFISYVTNRHILNNDENLLDNNNDNLILYELDSYFIKILFRLINIKNEILENNSSNPPLPPSSLTKSLYINIINNIKFLTFENLLTIFSVLGLQNVKISSHIFLSFVEFKSSLLNEVDIYAKNSLQKSNNIIVPFWQAGLSCQSSFFPKTNTRNKFQLNTNFLNENLSQLKELEKHFVFISKLTYKISIFFILLNYVAKNTSNSSIYSLIINNFFPSYQLNSNNLFHLFHIYLIFYDNLFTLLSTLCLDWNRLKKQFIDSNKLNLDNPTESSIFNSIDNLWSDLTRNLQFTIGWIHTGCDALFSTGFYLLSEKPLISNVSSFSSSISWMEAITHRINSYSLDVLGVSEISKYFLPNLLLSDLNSFYSSSNDSTEIISSSSLFLPPNYSLNEFLLLDLKNSNIDNDNSSYVSYLLSSLSINSSLLNFVLPEDNEETLSFSSSQLDSIYNNNDNENTNISSNNTSNNVKLNEQIDLIQSIMPDLGRGFIEICLGFYANDTEKIINLILTDSLDPALKKIDKKIEKISFGKKSEVSTANTLSSKNEYSYSDLMNKENKSNKEFYEYQKNLVLKMEQDAIKDAQIIKQEYDDDYDDQYDEGMAWKHNPEEVDMRPKASTYDEIKRYNIMMKESLAELKFWDSLKNPNKPGKPTKYTDNEEGEDVEEVQDKKPSASSSSSSSSSSAPSSASSSSKSKKSSTSNKKDSKLNNKISTNDSYMTLSTTNKEKEREKEKEESLAKDTEETKKKNYRNNKYKDIKRTTTRPA